MEDTDIEFLVEDALFWLHKIRTDRKPTQADIERATDLADRAIVFLQEQTDMVVAQYDSIEKLNRKLAGFIHSIEAGVVGHA